MFILVAKFVKVNNIKVKNNYEKTNYSCMHSSIILHTGRMRIKCFLCSIELYLGCLCKASAEEFNRTSDFKINLIEKPELKQH
jgi:hypothetical protein